MLLKRKFFNLLIAVVLPLSVVNAEIITAESTQSSSQTVLGSTVTPFKEVTVSAQFPGKIMIINGDVGSQFKKGDVLAKIDDASLLAKRNTLWTQVTAAQAAVRNSKTQYQREMVSPRSKSINGMPGMGVPSMMDIYFTRPFYDQMGGNSNQGYNRYSDLVSSQTGVAQAESQLMMLWSQLNELTTKIKDTVLIAPFDGIIMSKNIEVGDAVQPGQPLMKFGFVNWLRLKADVPSMLVAGLQKNMSLPVKVGKYKQASARDCASGAAIVKNSLLCARVSQIYPVADPSRHTVVVKFDLPVGVEASPGMYAEVYLPDSTAGGTKVITVPESVLIAGRSLPTVLVADEENKTSSLRLIRLGAKQGGGKVSVVSGLKAGERVINNPPTGATRGWYPES